MCLPSQGYDSATLMSGLFNRVQTYIKKIHTLTIYVRCSARSLNLAVSKSCSMTEIRDCLYTLSKVRDFFICLKRKYILNYHNEHFYEITFKKNHYKEVLKRDKSEDFM